MLQAASAFRSCPITTLIVDARILPLDVINSNLFFVLVKFTYCCIQDLDYCNPYIIFSLPDRDIHSLSLFEQGCCLINLSLLDLSEQYITHLCGGGCPRVQFFWSLPMCNGRIRGMIPNIFFCNIVHLIMRTSHKFLMALEILMLVWALEAISHKLPILVAFLHLLLIWSERYLSFYWLYAPYIDGT